MLSPVNQSGRTREKGPTIYGPYSFRIDAVIPRTHDPVRICLNKIPGAGDREINTEKLSMCGIRQTSVRLTITTDVADIVVMTNGLKIQHFYVFTVTLRRYLTHK